MAHTAAELARLILRLSPYLRRLPLLLELQLLDVQATTVRAEFKRTDQRSKVPASKARLTSLSRYVH